MWNYRGDTYQRQVDNTCTEFESDLKESIRKEADDDTSYGDELRVLTAKGIVMDCLWEVSELPRHEPKGSFESHHRFKKEKKMISDIVVVFSFIFYLFAYNIWVMMQMR